MNEADKKLVWGMTLNLAFIVNYALGAVGTICMYVVGWHIVTRVAPDFTWLWWVAMVLHYLAWLQWVVVTWKRRRVSP